MAMPRISLIHAVTVAMAPVHAAFRELWPAAECVDILDTSLSRDRERDGELTAAMTRRIGVLADFAAALAAGRRIGMLATFEPSVAGMAAEFREMAAAAGSPAVLETHCVPAAMRALQAGDGGEHDRLLAAAAPRLAGCDAILLAHFSTSRAAAAVRAAVPCPVLTAPGAAVARLKGLIG